MERHELDRAAASEKYAEDEYKLDNIERADGDVISFYRQGDWEDLCRGPHVPSTGKIGHFKLMSVAGAYWHGDESKNQLTRVYGTTWATREALDEHLKMIEEAKKRDHRKLGRELGIYTMDDEVGPGLPLWLPKGTKMTPELAAAIKKPYNLFQLDMVAFPGNSGSPLFETRTGTVIGIINMTLAKKTREHLFDKPSGIAYAVPMRWVHELIRRQSIQDRQNASSSE